VGALQRIRKDSVEVLGTVEFSIHDCLTDVPSDIRKSRFDDRDDHHRDDDYRIGWWSR
jgi:hypothetical protein